MKTDAQRQSEHIARQKEWLREHGFTMKDAKALVTALMKLDAKQIETLRRWVEQANKKGQ